ncbi:hypothetical protein EDB80DRAFT_878922 [Ilyonectria destructans]|nr:hypothetical protein EDB80DRAFT_878922 [Ilyonectria destructans]
MTILLPLSRNSCPGTKANDPSKIVFTMDHDIQNESKANLAKYANTQEFARKHGI